MFNFKRNKDKMKYINCRNNTHLSFMKDLPHNCVFNKVVTGCGGTTVALENDVNYIIAVPTVELIINKLNITSAGLSTIKTHSNKEVTIYGWFGEQENNSSSVLGKYIHSKGVKKIMVTYNKVNALLKMMEGIKADPKNFRLLVDEFHILFKSANFRNTAVFGTLENFRGFKSFCFMSATPLLPDYEIEELKDVRRVECKWNNTDKLHIELQKTNRPYIKALQYINLLLKEGSIKVEGKESKHLFIFLNSVTDIAAIIENSDLTPEQVNIICSDNSKNEKKLPEGFEIVTSKNMKDCPITFLTSKAFEGCDFFCKDALSLLVSNTNCKHSLLDISTDIPQIAGRFRDAETFRNQLIHIYNTARGNALDDITPEDIKNGVELAISTKQKTVKFWNEVLTDEERLKQFEDCPKDLYSMKDGKIIYRATLDRLKYYEYKIQNVIYSDSLALRASYNEMGIETSKVNWSKLEGKLKRANCPKTFKDAFLEYDDIKDKKSQEAKELAELFMMDRDHSLLIEAYNKLGVDKVRELRYYQNAVTMALENLDSTKSTFAKVTKAVVDTFSLGFHSSKEIKSKLGTIYNSIGNLADKKSTKATDIADFFEVKEGKIRDNGKQVRGFFLVAPKAITVSPKEEIIVEEDKQTKVDWDAINYNEMLDELYDDKDENAA